MIEDYKDSEIILCSGIAIDKNYDNVLDISKSSLVGHLRTHSEYVGNDYSILPRNRNSLIVSCPYRTALKCNYMTFRNPDYENEYVFAFVDTVDYINDEASQINFTLDIWHTYHDKFNIEKVFVEREHVSDDTVGLHTIPEGLETGDYVVSDYFEREIDGVQNNGYIVIGLSNLPGDNPAIPAENAYNGVFSGLTYYVLENYTDARNYITGITNAIGFDAQASVYCLFIIPRELINYNDIVWYTQQMGGVNTRFGVLPSSYEPKVMSNELILHKGTKLDNYTPVNNKCYVFPYNYCYVTNNIGNSAIYNFEDFLDNDAHFRIIGGLSVGCSIRIDPIKYKNGFFNIDDQSTLLDNRRLKNYGLTCGKFPTCSWNSDSFTNWLTTNAINIGLKGVASIAQTAVGVGTANPEGILSGVSNIAGTIGEVYQHSLMPNQVEGNINSGDVLFSSNSLGFSLYRMTIKKEYCKIIDQYFSRFGYKVHEIKTPTLHNRTQFDFIKVGGTDNLISGKIPSKYLDEINAICRRGVTIFHNLTNFGDYMVANPIIEP